MIDTNMLGFRELYDVQLKATYPMEIEGHLIDVGEPIAVFQSVQFGNAEEFKNYAAAKGGYGNQSRVTWDTTKEVNFNFTQGIFSRLHLAILSNSDMQEKQSIPAPMVEALAADENSKITLRQVPIANTLFIYKDGARIRNFTIDGKEITFENLPYENFRVVYDFDYTNGADNIIIGRRLIQGYLELCGKTRLKDDKSGQTVTGIIRIPRLKLMSDLSMRLGKDVPPVVGNFKMTGYPVGSKGNERVMDFILLNDDIDSDI